MPIDTARAARPPAAPISEAERHARRELAACYRLADRMGWSDILKTLFEASVRPEFTYRHHWRLHDMILWDNRCAMHKALRDRMPGTYRHMHRTTVDGEPCGALYQGSV